MFTYHTERPMLRLNALLSMTVLSLACGADGATSGSPPVQQAVPTPTPTTPTPTPTPTNAQPGTFAKGTVSVRGAAYPYQVFVPKAYTQSQKWPVILFVHGANEKGSDGDKQVTGCFGPDVKARSATFPAIAVFPQIPQGENLVPAARFEIITASLDAVMKEYAGDPTRVYLTGFSMGGGMGYELAFRDTTRFAAFAPVSAMLYDRGILGAATEQPVGSANAVTAARLRTLPMWVFHGTNDAFVNISIPRAMIQAFRSAGATALQYTEIQGGSHDCGTAYSSQAFYDWMFAQHR